jgi:hypothetical protein
MLIYAFLQASQITLVLKNKATLIKPTESKHYVGTWLPELNHILYVMQSVTEKIKNSLYRLGVWSKS